MSLQEQVLEVITKNMGCKIHSTADTLDSLGVDSLDRVEIVMDLEDEFSIEVSDEEMANLVTVADLINLVEAKLPQPAA